ncbi:hypothetical protein E3N88_19939 [Mikania micrantha]|uniref:C2H2-type domain-containing protein n=1 Tax=Mikania micrantha TaxID=192012 RepID=A0A5N6NRI8_9ASTR|nr:hypothetical protein E3N88_19939 [Mikania micrantha]
MFNFVKDFEEDEELFHNAILIQSSHGSPNTTETGVDNSIHPTTALKLKKKRNLPGNPGMTLMATHRYICEVCHKGFQRDQNLQLHRRGHNLPWKLKQRPANIQVKKRVYVCPEPNCVHHEPTRALGDLTGIKKHFCRKHGEKKWKCDKCSKRYAVQSDWKAHAKICGTREYHCDCGTIFSRKDSFVTHRAFCDALTEENYKINLKVGAIGHNPQEPCTNPNTMMKSSHDKSVLSHISTDFDPISDQRTTRPCFSSSEPNNSPMAAYTSATALLQKAAEMGAKVGDNTITPILLRGFTGYSISSVNGVPQVPSIDTCNTTTAIGLHAINQEMFDNNIMETDNNGLYDSSLLMHLLKRNRQGFMGGSERTTVDFLGVEPGGLCGKRDYTGIMVGMPYSNEHHT